MWLFPRAAVNYVVIYEMKFGLLFTQRLVRTSIWLAALVLTLKWLSIRASFHIESTTRWLPFSQTKISKTFRLWKLLYLIQISLKFVPSVHDNNNRQTLVQIMAWHRTSDMPLSEPMVTYITEIFTTLPRWVNCEGIDIDCLPLVIAKLFRPSLALTYTDPPSYRLIETVE